MRNVFKDMITKSVLISKPKMKEILQKEDWGKEILKKTTLHGHVREARRSKKVAIAKHSPSEILNLNLEKMTVYLTAIFRFNF